MPFKMPESFQARSRKIGSSLWANHGSRISFAYVGLTVETQFALSIAPFIRFTQSLYSSKLCSLFGIPKTSSRISKPYWP